MSVQKYRIYCNTESSNVYQWSSYPPTVCPNASNHTIDSNSVIIVDKIESSSVNISNLSCDTYQNLKVVQKTPVIDLKSFFGVSLLKNIITTVGNASVSNSPENNESEFTINCTGSNDSIVFRSAERGRYIGGLSCEMGIALRLNNNNLTNNQILKWGYFDNNNGFYFKLTNNNFSVCILNNNIETQINRQDFNIDKMDGNGISKYNLDFIKGNIFKIDFSWYGYGIVKFSVVGLTNSEQQKLPFHIYQTVGTTSVKTPNLPISVSLNNNGTVANTNVYIAGRQFSIMGIFTPFAREAFFYRYKVAISHETFIPIFSIKKKLHYEGCTVTIKNIEVKSNVDCIIKIIYNGTLLNSDFNNSQYESNVECDYSSTNITGGILVYSSIIHANNITNKDITFPLHLIDEIPLTIITKSLTGDNGDISVSLSWDEFH
jgi:hypothetical protein